MLGSHPSPSLQCSSFQFPVHIVRMISWFLTRSEFKVQTLMFLQQSCTTYLTPYWHLTTSCLTIVLNVKLTYKNHWVHLNLNFIAKEGSCYTCRDCSSPSVWRFNYQSSSVQISRETRTLPKTWVASLYLAYPQPFRFFCNTVFVVVTIRKYEVTKVS